MSETAAPHWSEKHVDLSAQMSTGLWEAWMRVEEAYAGGNLSFTRYATKMGRLAAWYVFEKMERRGEARLVPWEEVPPKVRDSFRVPA